MPRPGAVVPQQPPRLLCAAGNRREALRHSPCVTETGRPAGRPGQDGLRALVGQELRVLQRQHLDAVQRDIGLVERYKGGYCGEHALALFTDQQDRNAKYLEANVLVNENGDQLSLAEVTSHTIANPTIRRAELMARLRGFETVADLVGHEGTFYTLTTPSKYHATLHDGRPNPRYRGHSPTEAQDWLCRIVGVGARQAPPRRAAPLWLPCGRTASRRHAALALHPVCCTGAAPRISAIFRSYALMDPEPGANRHRFKAIRIDKAQGSATGYFAKYISKNIDGANIHEDLHGNDPASARRITAWARTWNIRQFQQIGGPSVTVWRELRRLKSATDHPLLEPSRLAADASDWAAFVVAMGGVDAPRDARPIQPFRVLRESLDVDTGEIVTESTAWHGGNRAAPVQGLRCGTDVWVTRKHVWTMAPKAKLHNEDLTRWPRSGPPGLSEAGSNPRREAPPWTRVNNCTGPHPSHSRGAVYG